MTHKTDISLAIIASLLCIPTAHAMEHAGLAPATDSFKTFVAELTANPRQLVGGSLAVLTSLGYTYVFTKYITQPTERDLEILFQQNTTFQKIGIGTTLCGLAAFALLTDFSK